MNIKKANMSKSTTVSILGSTGSIGVQTLEVINHHLEQFNVRYLTTNERIDILAQQIEKYQPKGVVITDDKAFNEFKSNTSFKGKILFGIEGLIEAASDTTNDLVISALVGFAGVVPTLSAIRNGNDIALANKETLVSAGSVIMSEAKKYNVKIRAIDSEHSAILQCLVGESIDEVSKIILTASGGPFRSLPLEEFESISVEQALAHPNWSMGNKITIDSATMMNKGFELIEAYWLFGLDFEQIEIVIHPQSIIHSLVEFIDGSVKAQLGMPDMRIPISYALNLPERKKYNFKKLDFKDVTTLTFEQPDFNRYPSLRLAYESLEKFGTAPTILNAANEIAVNAFLNQKIKFNGISSVTEKTLNSMDIITNPTIDEIIETDKETRKFVKSLIY